jgi:hypothetical protein
VAHDMITVTFIFLLPILIRYSVRGFFVVVSVLGRVEGGGGWRTEMEGRLFYHVIGWTSKA